MPKNSRNTDNAGGKKYGKNRNCTCVQTTGAHPRLHVRKIVPHASLERKALGESVMRHPQTRISGAGAGEPVMNAVKFFTFRPLGPGLNREKILLSPLQKPKHVEVWTQTPTMAVAAPAQILLGSCAPKSCTPPCSRKYSRRGRVSRLPGAGTALSWSSGLASPGHGLVISAAQGPGI